MNLNLSTGLLFVLALSLPIQSYGMHIVIDPGHGGRDKGATRGKVYESTITLKVSNYLKSMLQKDPRFNVTLTRQENKTVSLNHRTKTASQVNGDLLLSIHVNTSMEERAKGLEVYFQNQLPPDEESLFLAKMENLDLHGKKDTPPDYKIPNAPSKKSDVYYILQDLMRNTRHRKSSELAKNLVIHWAGTQRPRQSAIRQAPFYVISNTNMPAALIELGYLSNDRESRLLTTSAYQKKVAQGIYNGLVAFYNSQ